MASTQVLRIGKVSSINYANGTARVTYEDRDGATTAELPFLAWEYWMPDVSDQVVVGHLSAGGSAVILGPVWHTAHRPPTGGVGVYRKEMANSTGKAYILYTDTDGVYKVTAEHIAFVASADGESLTVAGIAQTIRGLQSSISDLEKTVAALSDRIASLEG